MYRTGAELLRTTAFHVTSMALPLERSRTLTNFGTSGTPENTKITYVYLHAKERRIFSGFRVNRYNQLVYILDVTVL